MAQDTITAACGETCEHGAHALAIPVTFDGPLGRTTAHWCAGNIADTIVTEQITAPTTGAFVAGWNMGGYLPETDPVAFETIEQATAYLREEVARWIDQDADGAIAGPDSAVLAENGMEWTGPYATDPRPTDEIAAEIIATDGATYADGWYGDTHLWAEWSPGATIEQD